MSQFADGSSIRRAPTQNRTNTFIQVDIGTANMTTSPLSCFKFPSTYIRILSRAARSNLHIFGKVYKISSCRQIYYSPLCSPLVRQASRAAKISYRKCLRTFSIRPKTLQSSTGFYSSYSNTDLYVPYAAIKYSNLRKQSDMPKARESAELLF